MALQTPPGDHIRQLVCGLAEPDRSNRLLLMLTAFMDDSDMSGEGPMAVLAGWLMSSSQWADFSDDWRKEVLTLGGERLKVFKPTTRDLRDERNKARLLAAMALIGRYNPLGLLATIPHGPFKAEMAKVAKKRLRSPYLYASVGMVLLLTKDLTKRNVEGPVDFVFDYQPGQTGPITQHWDSLYRSSWTGDRYILKKSPPKFEDDESIVALQAAHLLAWNVRWHAGDTAAGRLQYVFPWPEHIRILHMDWRAADVAMVADAVSKTGPPTKRRRSRGREG